MTKTNLLDNSVRYDLYLEVAAETVKYIDKKINNILKNNGPGDDDEDENKIKLARYNLMKELMNDHGRALAKTPTMTRVYSATKRNSKSVVRDKVKSKIKSFSSQEEKKEVETAAYFLGGIIHDMVNVVVPGASEYQKAVRTSILDIYKNKGREAYWITPDGLVCRNIKYKSTQTETKVPVIGKKRSKLRRLSIAKDKNGKMVLSSSRMANGASPNTIHTVDAYFLRSVVNKAYEEGITKLVTIHDSFSCDLNNCDRFNEILREVLVDIMTSGDIQDMFASMGFNVPVIDKMKKEEFEQILDNPYCFA